MELRNASVAIVDEDRSAAFRPHHRRAACRRSSSRPQPIGLNEIDAAMDAGRYTFVIDIPPRFQADLEARRNPTIQLNVDATAMSQAGRGAGYIQSIIAQEVQRFRGVHRRAPESPVRLVTRAKFNPNLTETWFLAVSQIINNITMLAIILSGAAVVREREHGTIEHLLVMPLHAQRHHAGEDLVERAGDRGRVHAVAALRRAGHAGCAYRRVDPAVHGGHRHLHVLGRLARHLPRHHRTLDAPVRPARPPGVSWC